MALSACDDKNYITTTVPEVSFPHIKQHINKIFDNIHACI